MKSVFQTDCCSTCQTLIVHLNDQIGLIRAAVKGNIDKVSHLLKAGIQHSSRDLLNLTPLLQAALQGHQGVV